MRKEFEAAIDKMMSKQFLEIIYKVRYQEDLLADKLRSETNLMTILGIITAVILLAIVLLIALSVGSRVWRTARENPAEVIKRGN